MHLLLHLYNPRDAQRARCASRGLYDGARLDGTYRMHKDGSEIGQMCLVSTFSERTVVSYQSLVVVPDYYPLNKAVLVGCGVATGVGAVIHRAKVEPDSTVMVVGCGGIGMNAVQGLLSLVRA